MSTIAVNSITPATGSTVSIDSFVPAGQFGWRNKIINGDMNIAQRGTSFAAIANQAYSLDRWIYGNTSAAVATVTQQADVPSSNEFQYSYRYAVTTADTSIAASDAAYVVQFVEGYNARDLIGRTFTLSFWVRSSKTGTHCVKFGNSSADRSYVTEYTINAANTWEQKSITVSGGLITAGTWNWTNGIGLAVFWTLAAGSTFQTTAGAWQTGNFLATANQVSCLDTVGNIFAITGVQLEVGSVATPFEHRPYGTELALCQRYYFRTSDGYPSGSAYSPSATAVNAVLSFPVTMRAAPSALEQSGTATDYTVLNGAGSVVTCSAVPTFLAGALNSSRIQLTVASGLTAGQGSSVRLVGGYFGWSAEL